MEKIQSDSSTPWLVCLAAALFFYFVFFQLVMFNSISHDIMQDFHIHSTLLGYLSSSYFFADALCIIPAGILLNRFSTRKLCLVVMLASVLSTYLLAMTHSFSLALISRIMGGVGNAFAFLGSMQLAARWLPAKRLALGISLIITIFLCGGIVAQTPLMLLISYVGWRWAMVVNASIGVLILIYMFFYLRDYPKGKKPHLYQVSGKILTEQFVTALKNSQNWICSLYITLMNFPIIILGELWGIMYLSQTKQLPMVTAGHITSMLFIGIIIGSPILGWLSDRFESRVKLMLITAILLLFMLFFIMFDNSLSLLELSFSFFIMGFLSGGQSIGYPTVAESNPPAITGMAMSIVAILFNLISFFIQPFFGWLIHFGWNGEILNNTPIYAANDFHRAMWILPISCLICIFLAMRTKETFGKGIKE